MNTFMYIHKIIHTHTSCSATADGRTPSVDVSDEYATFLCCSLACNALCASANAFAAAFRAETADSTHFEAFLSRLLRVVVSSHAFLCRCMAFFSCFSVSPRQSDTANAAWMCVCVFICVCIHIYVYVYVSIYMCVCVYMCVYISICICICIYIYICIYTYIY